ncbi:transcription activator MSS11, partial [Candida albicans Ca529L]
PNLNQMTNPSGILTPQHQMIVQQRMLQQQQQLLCIDKNK